MSTASRPPASSGTRPPVRRPLARATVTPALPLALLEAMRVHDRPREVLEDEDLTISLPRRLGLTGVIESQIHRYEEARRRKQAVPADEAADLLRLVLRRPDAEAILREAGGDVARSAFRRGRPMTASIMRVLPRFAVHAAIRRAARRVFRRILGRGRIEITGRPPVARVVNGLAAEVDASGMACTLYAGVLEEVIFLYTRERPNVQHTLCAARGASYCEWTVAEGVPAGALAD